VTAGAVHLRDPPEKMHASVQLPQPQSSNHAVRECFHKAYQILHTAVEATDMIAEIA